MIPIEIVNKILLYVGELNNNVVITQYHITSRKEYYKINFDSNLLWRIKANIRMKQLYPIYNGAFNKKESIELYRFGVLHYQKELQLMNKC